MTQFVLRKFCASALFLALATSTAWAADNKVTLNFVNSDMESAIKAVGLITGKNFMIDPKVKGTINIVSNQPVARDLVYPIFLSALRQQGFTAIEQGGVIKVLPETDAKLQGGAVLDKNSKLSGDRLITQVYPLRFESATQLAATLRPLVSPNSVLTAHQAANVLVITDYAENVHRLNRIIETIDQPSTTEVVSIPVQYASVLDIAQTIAKLMPEVVVQGVTPATAPPVDGVRRSVVIPDLRNNQLLVRNEAPIHVQQIRKLVATLDTQGATGSNINVIYLKNAEAVRLAGTLKGILSGQGGSESSGSGSTSTAATTSTSSLLPSSSSTSPQSVSASVQVGGVTVILQADATTNSLIVTAPDHLYNKIRAVIDKLDVRRAQVYVEAMIAEVKVSKLGEFGFQFLAGGGNNNVGFGLATALGSSTTGIGTIASAIISQDASKLPGGLTVGVLNGDPTSSTNRPSLGMLVSALQQSGDANVLSTPNLLTLDNEEAKITVGQNIPIITGSQASSSNNTNPFVTVERKDVGIKLRVKPQVSEGGSITLNVFQEVSSVDNSVSTNGAGLATKIRTLETKVLVDDGQIIVLGGLIEDQLGVTQNKVPLLGDIPYLGALFRYESREWQKVNLMIFLRPVILRDGKASTSLSTDRYEYLRKQQGAFEVPGNLMLPDSPKVQLPELGKKPGIPAEDMKPVSPAVSSAEDKK